MNIEVRDIARELYKGNITKFSKGTIDEKQAEDIIMNKILEVCDCKEKFSEYKFNNNIDLVFEILSEALAYPLMDGMVMQYQDWTDVENVDYNVTKEYTLPNNKLFNVGVVAEGTMDFDRQRLLKNKLKLSGFNVGLSIYTEFHDVRTGKLNFTEWIDRVRESLDYKIMQIIVKLIESSYSTSGTNIGFTGTYSDSTMINLVQQVKAKAKVQKVKIYGTLSALSNLKGISDADKEDIRQFGRLRMWNGVECVEIPQCYDNDDKFVVNDKVLYVIPDGAKIVKLAFEGEPRVKGGEINENGRDDSQIEFAMMQRIQVGVLKSVAYGMYIIG